MQLQPSGAGAARQRAAEATKDFKLIRTPAKRLDTTGQGRRPGGIRHRYEVGGDDDRSHRHLAVLAAAEMGEEAAPSVKGRRQVVRIDEAVAVVADHMWAAEWGLKHRHPMEMTGECDGRQRESHPPARRASSSPAWVARNEGDAETALAGAAQRIEAIYQLPFLAHAAMEPMTATVHLARMVVTLGRHASANADPGMSRSSLACRRDAVKIHNHRWRRVRSATRRLTAPCSRQDRASR